MWKDSMATTASVLTENKSTLSLSTTLIQALTPICCTRIANGQLHNLPNEVSYDGHRFHLHLLDKCMVRTSTSLLPSDVHV